MIDLRLVKLFRRNEFNDGLRMMALRIRPIKDLIVYSAFHSTWILPSANVSIAIWKYRFSIYEVEKG